MDNINPEEFNKWYEKIVKLIAMRPRSEQEIKNYLKKKQIDPQIQVQLLEKLSVTNLINDLDFAIWWVEQRITFGRLGKQAVNFELKQKGVAQYIINQAIAGYSSDQETEVAKKIIQKKLSLWKKIPKPKLTQKIYQFLLQKGFSGDLIKQIIQDFNCVD